MFSAFHSFQAIKMWDSSKRKFCSYDRWKVVGCLTLLLENELPLFTFANHPQVFQYGSCANCPLPNILPILPPPPSIPPNRPHLELAPTTFGISYILNYQNLWKQFGTYLYFDLTLFTKYLYYLQKFGNPILIDCLNLHLKFQLRRVNTTLHFSLK